MSAYNSELTKLGQKTTLTQIGAYVPFTKDFISGGNRSISTIKELEKELKARTDAINVLNTSPSNYTLPYKSKTESIQDRY